MDHIGLVESGSESGPVEPDPKYLYSITGLNSVWYGLGLIWNKVGPCESHT